MDYVTTVSIGPPGNVFRLVSDSRDPAPDPAAGLWTLDGYKHTWQMPSDEYPRQPEPATASLKLATTNAADLPPLDIGTPVLVEVEAFYPDNPGYGWEVATFGGRISDAVARTKGDGLEVALTAVDYTADLAEEYVAAQPWPEDYPADRLDRIMAAAGLTWAQTQVWDSFDTFRALDVDHRSVADVLEEHFSQLTHTSGYLKFYDAGWERGIVQYHLDPDGAVAWEQAVLAERTASGGPLALTMGPAGLTATSAPTPASASSYDIGSTREVPADRVDLDVSWRRDKGQSTNRATVTGEFAGIFGELGNSLAVTVPEVTAEHPDVVTERGPITVTKASTLAYIHSARLLAAMLLPAREDLASRWAVDSFRLYVSRLAGTAEHRMVFPLLPSPASVGYSGAATEHPAGAAVVVYGVRPGQNPGGRAWLAGRLIGAELSIVGGDIVVDVRLAPTIPRPPTAYGATDGTFPGQSVTWAGLKTIQGGAYAATSWDQVDPDLTWEDLRVTRNGD